MLEYADDIIFGLKALLKATGAEKGVIVVKENKRDALELLESKTADIANIVVVVAWAKYPQGSERILLKHTLGRSVPSGCLPHDVGVVVCNASTVKAVSDAIKSGMPLIERVVTVSGEKILNPGNFTVKIGTSVKEIVDYCGGVTDDYVTFKLGGPMMGDEIANLDVPVVKGTNGIVAIEPDISEPSECIKCGRCADVCPMELFPLFFPRLAGKGDLEGMREKSVMDCIECGCCQFICSSKIPLVDAIKIGKRELCE